MERNYQGFIYEYKKLNSFKERLSESNALIEKYQNKIPIIVEKHPKSRLQQVEKKKFLIYKHFTLLQLNQIIRKNLDKQISSSEALYVFCENQLLMANQDFNALYQRFQDKDGFLYLTYCEYTTFG